jgi:ribosomal protein L9
MDVILIKDNHLGKKYEIVKVKGGFARNFLIPNGIDIDA